MAQKNSVGAEEQAIENGACLCALAGQAEGRGGTAAMLDSRRVFAREGIRPGTHRARYNSGIYFWLLYELSVEMTHARAISRRAHHE